MARISPAPGSPITLSNILANMGVAAFNNSIDATEILAMGGGAGTGGGRRANPAAAYSFCMPYQKEALKSLGTPVQYFNYNANWTSTAATNWRPARFSEFRNAYTNKPSVAGDCARKPGGPSSQCIMTVTASNSDAYSSGSTPYFFFITGSGSFPGQGTWVQANNPAGTQYSTTASSVSEGSSSFLVRVVDHEGCGNNNEFFSSFSY